MNRLSLFFLLILLFWSFSSLAQVKPHLVLNDPDYDTEKRLRFGFAVGTNFMHFQIKNKFDQEGQPLFASVSRLHPGFNVNALSHFSIVPGLQLRFSPGLAFGQRDIDFFEDDGRLNGTVKIESSFIEIPLYFKYNAERKTNARPYLIGGANYRIDLARKSNRSSSLGQDEVGIGDEDTFFTLKRGDIYYDFGAGYEFYLEYFKFSIELRFSSGFLNVLDNYDDTPIGKRYYNAIDFLRSQVFTVSFNFE